MNTIKFVIAVSIVLISADLIANIAVKVYAQLENQTETGSFFRCYTSFSTFFLLSNQLSPVTIDLTDPQVKAYISNFCNFYHEKTGKWIEALKDEANKVSEEFNRTYYSTMPDSIKQFMNMSILE